MTVPTITEDSIRAFYADVRKDADLKGELDASQFIWMTREWEKLARHKQVLCDHIIGNISQMFPNDSGEPQAKALFMAVLVYLLINRQLDIDNLENLFKEDDDE